MQHGYFTPIKNIHSHQKKLFGSQNPQREGDWVCFNCQNLNYSFRKKCNRCKTQTRQDNEACSVYSYYYFPKIDQPLASNDINKKPILHEKGSTSSYSGQFEVNSFGHESKENCANQPNGCMQTPKKKKPSILSQSSKLDGLPSVSPLVKKYREKQHHTTLSKMKNIKFLESDSKNSFDNIKVRDFDKLIQQIDFPGRSFQNSPFKQNIEDQDSQGLMIMQEIEDSISRIII